MRDAASKPSRWLTTLGAPLIAWAVLAVWQWEEYRAECDAARQTLEQQADSIMSALVGGVQSHRRMGRFLQEQMQGVLDALADAKDVLAVGVASGDGRIELRAGPADLIELSPPWEPGGTWLPAGFRRVETFHVSSALPGPSQGEGPSAGMGPGRGGGWGRGGPGRRFDVETQSAPAGNEPFVAVLLIDRTRTDQQVQHFLWLRLLVTVAGGLVVFSVGSAWLATLRLADARTRASLLETEARHLRELSQAAAGLAHETRNPLGLIRGWTQRLAQTLAEGPQHQQALSVMEECDRVTARINQFLAFARPCEPRTAKFPLPPLVDELAALLEPDLSLKRLMIAARYASPDISVRGDREMLRQALFNLLQNAIGFSPEGGRVDVSVSVGEDGQRRIEVADRGAGVPPEIVDRLFTPYHTTRPGGAGLGLAVVRRIVSAHGWRTGYTPRPGGGSIFWLDQIHG